LAWAAATRRSNGRTTRNISATNGTANRTCQDSPPVAATVTTSASIDHASTSSTAAEPSARPPMAVRCMPRSVRMRASTGNAVTDMAAPRNSANGSTRSTWWRPASQIASVTPRPIGRMIDPTETKTATRCRPRTRA
jgi:hypothetical protein